MESRPTQAVSRPPLPVFLSHGHTVHSGDCWMRGGSLLSDGLSCMPSNIPIPRLVLPSPAQPMCGLEDSPRARGEPG